MIRWDSPNRPKPTCLTEPEKVAARGGLPAILQAVFCPFYQGHVYLHNLYTDYLLTSLSMELSSVAYEAYRALVQAQSPTWLVDEAGSVHDGDLRTAQHFAGSI